MGYGINVNLYLVFSYYIFVWLLLTGPSDRVLRGKVTAVSEDETIWKAEFVPREIGDTFYSLCVYCKRVATIERVNTIRSTYLQSKYVIHPYNADFVCSIVDKITTIPSYFYTQNSIKMTLWGVHMGNISIATLSRYPYQSHNRLKNL
jgi:hypothetical protein